MNFTDGLNLSFSSRLPTVLQSEAAECGLACLTMVSRYHGAPSDLAELRRRFGMSPTRIMLLAERIGEESGGDHNGRTLGGTRKQWKTMIEF